MTLNYSSSSDDEVASAGYTDALKGIRCNSCSGKS
jgi:hypothetical protein